MCVAAIDEDWRSCLPVEVEVITRSESNRRAGRADGSRWRDNKIALWNDAPIGKDGGWAQLRVYSQLNRCPSSTVGRGHDIAYQRLPTIERQLHVKAGHSTRRRIATP